jgi:hypothetical protein
MKPSERKRLGDAFERGNWEEDPAEKEGLRGGCGEERTISILNDARSSQISAQYSEVVVG